MGQPEDVGRVAELWRYPVKSMLGEPVGSIELTPVGVVGDRAFGLFDVASGHLLTAKVEPLLFTARARTAAGIDGAGVDRAGGGVAAGDGRVDGGGVDRGDGAGVGRGDGGGGGSVAVVIELPDGREVHSDDPDHAAALSAWIGRDVELRRSPTAGGDGAGPGAAVEFDVRWDPTDDAGDLVALQARQGTFLDAAPVHLLTTSSLATMAAAGSGTAWDVRRFRPNLLVGTGDAAGFVEDGWLGHEVTFGTGGPAIRTEWRCGRCAMPLRSQAALGDRPALDRDLEVFRSLSAEHGNDLGVYGEVSRPGVITVGDVVSLTT